jgi:RNA polymerase sigma-70 factor (ECF subfamily)
MSSDPSETAVLLQRMHSGDEAALARIVERDLEWIRGQVERRLGPVLRGRGETEDYLHDVVVLVLRQGPRFVVSDAEHFRRLLLRIVENHLRDQAAFHQAGKRDLRQEVAWPGGSTISLDLQASVTRPSEAATRSESAAWVNLALALLEPEDRRVIRWRQHEDLAFGEIATRLEIEEPAARKRFQRAIQRLGDRLVELRSGRLGDALDASGVAR